VIDVPMDAPIMRPRAHYEIALLIVLSSSFLAASSRLPGLWMTWMQCMARMARNMVQSGDWVIPHLDGVPYIEKAPLPYWLIAICYLNFWSA